METNKVFLIRDANFDERFRWNWETGIVEVVENFNVIGDTTHLNPMGDEDDEDYVIQGTRSLQDIYERCKSAILEPTSFTQVVKEKKWRQATEVEIEMIKKNETWLLVERPVD